ncbi:unnamed protein product [Ambrosiozyma monospora]|uniref:Unnamed protein product n=1 Tax=Ambrosiozyma monospora TaxID=43982 RepID=A0ACB5TA98_AMBMO|nr:unnamed protein product [Ambrosiozyma monospora]
MARKKHFYGRSEANTKNSAEESSVSTIPAESNASQNLQNSNNSEKINTEPSLLSEVEHEKNKRKRKLKETLIQQHKDKLSRQKKKRLDKYIEHQNQREEKQILFRKLQETKIDTSILKSTKLIGSGNKITKREQFLQALEQERQGKGDERTRDILYEKREVKKWDESDEEMTPTDNNSKKNDNANQVEENEFKSTSKVSSGFIDYRPTQGLTTKEAL